MSFSGGGGDKLKDSRAAGGIVVENADKYKQLEGLEKLFERAHAKIQELERLISREEKTTNSKVSDVGLHSAMQRQEKLLQMSRVVLKRDAFGTSVPWGHASPNKCHIPKAGENLPKTPDVRHGAGIPRHSYGLDDLNVSCTQSHTGRREEEEMYRRTGAIPKVFSKSVPRTALEEGVLDSTFIRTQTSSQNRKKSHPRGVESHALQRMDILEDSSFKDVQGSYVGMEHNGYGSLDRNAGKRNRLVTDKQRRHTKTIGNMPLSPITTVNAEHLKTPKYELGPDEQYLFGLPHVANVQSSKLSRTILASLSHTPSPKTPGPRITTEADSLNHLASDYSIVAANQPHSSFSGSSLYVGPSPTQNLTPVASNNNNGEEINVELRNSFYHPRPFSAGGMSPASGAERIANEFSAIRLEDTFSDDVVDSARNRSRELSVISKESTKPFEMADYFKYSSKFRGNNNSQSSDATSGSQNEQSRLSLSSGSSSSSSAVDAGFSARSLILKRYFTLPHEDSTGSFVPTAGETNSVLSAHLSNWSNLSLEAQNSLLHEFVATEEAAVLNSSRVSGQNMQVHTPQYPSSDQNGNSVVTVEEAPQLPPRQPREKKDSTLEKIRDPEGSDQAWVMETPTFV